MIISLREKMRQSINEINKKYNSNFTLEELERDLGHRVDKNLIELTLTELDNSDLSHVTGGINIYNQKIISTAILSLALATGCVNKTNIKSNKEQIPTLTNELVNLKNNEEIRKEKIKLAHSKVNASLKKKIESSKKKNENIDTELKYRVNQRLSNISSIPGVITKEFTKEEVDKIKKDEENKRQEKLNKDSIYVERDKALDKEKRNSLEPNPKNVNKVLILLENAKKGSNDTVRETQENLLKQIVNKKKP